jgi:hypothetical protein
VYILVYVDDILIVAKDLELRRDIKKTLMTTFDARDLGEAAYFLGWEIKRDRVKKTTWVTQQRMTNDLVNKYGMKNVKPRTTPMSVAPKMTKNGEELDTNVNPCSELVGSLLYLSVCTRPDIAQAIGALARYMSKPTTKQWIAAKGVLKYLAGTAYRICKIQAHRHHPYWSRPPRAGSRGPPAGTPLLPHEGVPPAGYLRRAQVPPSNWAPLRGVRGV